MRKEQIVAPLILFYSYAHEDQALRDQLEKHLRQLQRQGLISEWHDRKILPGGMWADEIDAHLERASIILLLVSPDFLSSDYCYDIEMRRALERHESGEARVVPIILRPCDWQHSPLQDLQCLPRDGKPVTQWPDQDEVFNTITQGLRRVIEQRQARARSPVPLSPLHRQNRIRMLRQVRATWIDGLLTQSLHHAATIELHLQDRPDVLANPWRLQVQELDQSPQALPNGTTIVQVYDRVEGELLILGEPGAGKTTLLLQLTATLLERAQRDERQPMPIVFHLSSWAEKRQPLRAWLVEELSTKYQVPRKIGQGWVDADQVLPLLDGLDEVAKDARVACVQQINDYYQSRLERGSSPIVICCRSEEYTALSTRIILQHAVSILPLTDEQINTYLEQAGEPVQALKQALNEDTELRSLARQPLMLNIFTFAYQGAQASELPTGATREELQHTIFATYVEHMLKRRGQSKRWQPEQVIRWLMFLAKQMQEHSQTVFSVENLQPTWLPKEWRILYRWCIGLVLGLVCELVVGLPFGLFYGLAPEPVVEQAANQVFGSPFGSVIRVLAGPNFLRLVVWLIAGPGFGLLVGLLIGLAFATDARINPAEALTWSWKKALSGLVAGLGVGLAIGLAIAISLVLVGELLGELVFGLVFGLASGLVSGVVVGLVVGSLSGLVVGLSGRRLERLSLSPNEGVWRSGKNGLLVGLVFGQAVGLLVGPICGVITGLVFGQTIGLAVAMAVVLCAGLFVVLYVALGMSES
jgi:GTPase SAR1 family protein